MTDEANPESRKFTRRRILATGAGAAGMLAFGAGCSLGQEESAETSGGTTTPEGTGTNGGSAVGTTPTASLPERFRSDEPVRVALAREIAIGAWFEQYLQGANAQAEALDIELLAQAAQGEQGRHIGLVEDAIRERVDGIVVGHGRTDALMPPIRRALDADIPVVTDNLVMPIDEVTEIDQDDFLMSLQALSEMVRQINGKGNVVYVWVGGFTAMEKRHRIWDIMKWRFQGLEEIARYGAATDATQADTQARTEAVLNQFPEGSISAIWAPWDEFTKGATEAVMQAGRNEIQVFGVDMSDVDVQMMRRENSPWKAAAAADAYAIGALGIRAIAQKIAGERVPKYLSAEPALVTRDYLLENDVSTVAQLRQEHASFGKSTLAISPWMTVV